MRLIFAPVVILLLLTTGCRHVDRVVYASFADIPAEGWDPLFTPVFNPWPVDSIMTPTDRYDVELVVRCTSTCQPESLPVVVEQSDSSGRVTADTLFIPLQKDLSSRAPLPMIRSSRLSTLIKECSDTIARDFHPAPGWNVTLYNLLNQKETKGILSIGVVMEIK